MEKHIHGREIRIKQAAYLVAGIETNRNTDIKTARELLYAVNFQVHTVDSLLADAVLSGEFFEC